MRAVDTTIRHIASCLRGDPQLAALTEGRIFEGVAPEGVRYPLVLVQIYGDPETIVYNGGAIAHTQVDVVVRAVSPGDSIGVLLPLASRIHVALHDTSGEYETGAVTSCHQTNETMMSETNGGRVYRYLGGRFHLTVS